MPLFLKTGNSLGTVLRAYSSSHLEGRGKRITGIQELRDNPGQLNLARTNEWNIKKLASWAPQPSIGSQEVVLRFVLILCLESWHFKVGRDFSETSGPHPPNAIKSKPECPRGKGLCLWYCEFWVKGGFCRFPSFHHLQGSFFSWRGSFFVLQVLFIFGTLSAI